MKSSKDYNTDANFALLLIGPPKHGKTRVAFSFPKVAVLDCDGNLGDIRRQGIDFLYENPNIDDKGNQLTDPLSWKKSCDWLSEALRLPDSECQTVVVDGLSILSNYLVGALSRHSKLEVGGEKVMDMTLWQPFRNKMQQFVLQARTSGKRFIMTCHEDIVTDDKTGAVVGYRPLIPGQLKQNLAGFFSDCWRVEAKARMKGAEYSIRFAPQNLMQIGNSLGIKEPTLDVTDKTPQQIWSDLEKYFR